ncbi:MAG: DinB family protein, partial [Candidatus Methylomirabilales bacterium]
MDPKIALLLEMERSVWSHIWQNLTGLTEEEYRWRPLPQANDINWILRHLAGYERYCGNVVRGVDVGRAPWPDAPFPQIKRDLEELTADYQQAIAPLRWDD